MKKLSKLEITLISISSLMAIALIVSIIIGSGNWYSASNPRIYLTPPDHLKQMIEHVRVVGNLLDKENIKMVASAGTALGLARSNAPIPWDDDVDVFVHVEDEERLVSVLTKAQDEYILTFHESNFGYQLQLNNIDSQAWLDIFILSVAEDGNLRYGKNATALWLKRDSKIDFLTEDEWKNTSKQLFGDAKIHALTDPNEYLSRYYGQRWKSNAKVDNGRHKSLFSLDWNSWKRLYKRDI